jgi:uncharacterized RDD family membrane protein YckC
MPEGQQPTTFQGLPAGIVSRTLAAVVDALVALGIAVGLWGGATAVRFIARPRRFTVPSPTVSFALAMFSLVAVLYLAASWALVGRTAGAQLLGLRVTRLRGQRTGWLRSLARATLYVVFPVGLAWSAVSRSRRSLQDLLVGTVVVYDWGHQSVKPATLDEP